MNSERFSAVTRLSEAINRIGRTWATKRCPGNLIEAYYISADGEKITKAYVRCASCHRRHRIYTGKFEVKITNNQATVWSR